MPSTLAILEGAGHYSRYARIAQPNWPEQRFVRFAV